MQWHSSWLGIVRCVLPCALLLLLGHRWLGQRWGQSRVSFSQLPWLEPHVQLPIEEYGLLVSEPQPRRNQECRREWEGTWPLAVTIPVMVALLLLSALFTVAVLGLMAMDTIGLQITADGDDEKARGHALTIIKIRKNTNQLVCTLLLGNVAANAAFAILAADITTIYHGLLISVWTILLVAEIVPEAVCTRYALQVGANLVPMAYFFMFVFYIITKPLSWMVRAFLGGQLGRVRARAELIERLQDEKSQLDSQVMLADKIAKQVAEGALKFRNKSVGDVMTPVEDVYMLPSTRRLSYTTIREIFETGFTRIPVYGANKHDFLGLLVTKDLMLADPEDEMQVGDFIRIFKRKVETFYQKTLLADVLHRFKRGGTHMGLVREVNTSTDTNPHFENRGVVTLEDVIEEILQEDIVDETDVYKDVDRGVKVLDGREKQAFNLGAFHPLWRSRRERLSRDEVNAISAYLQRTLFRPGTGLELSFKAIEWLVTKAGVQERKRVAPLAQEQPHELDLLYEKEQESDRCTLILQGRVDIRVGVDKFRSEAGAFTVLGRDALCPGDVFVPDYIAFPKTQLVRLVVFTKAFFLEALALEHDQDKLDKALGRLAAEAAGEETRIDVGRRQQRVQDAPVFI